MQTLSEQPAPATGPVITPTVGRIVWYHPSTVDNDLARFNQAHVGAPFAAIVCHVWTDRLINLMVLDPNGNHYSRTSVYMHQADEPRPDVGTAFAEWMPYQKGQAAKTEQLQAKLAGE